MDTEMENVLAEIENLVGIHQCNNVIIVRDINMDYKRENGRVERLNTFLSDNDFQTAWKDLSGWNIDYTYEFEKDGVTYTSTIWNNELRKNVLDAGVLHSVQHVRS